MKTKPTKVTISPQLQMAMDAYAARQAFSVSHQDIIRMALRRLLEVEGLFEAQVQRTPPAGRQ